MNNQKGFANIVLVVVIVILVGVVGYFTFVKKSEPVVQQTTPPPTTTQTPTPQQPSPTPANETASWKMYTNTQYGFSLKYPSTVSVSLVGHVPPHGTDLILPCDGSQGTYNYSTCGAKGSGNGLEKDGSVGDAIGFWISQMPMTNLEAYARNYQGGEFTKININGKEAYQLHFGSAPNGVNNVYMQNSGHVFIFRYSDANTQAAKAILATVQLQ